MLHTVLHRVDLGNLMKLSCTGIGLICCKS